MSSLRSTLVRRARVVVPALAASLALTACGIGGTSHQPHPVDDGGVHLAANADTTAQPNIIGGSQDTEVHPWIASLEMDIPLSDPKYPGQKDFHTCTASQFAPHWIVLNAHCATFDDGTPYDAATIAAYNMHVRVGSNDRFHGGTVLPIKRFVPVPGWNWGVLDDAGRVNDHMLAEVVGELPGQSLPISPTTAKPRQNVQLDGWGYTDPSGTGVAPQYLQKTSTYVEPDIHACDTSITGDLPVSVGELCVHNMYGTNGICYGDSGGPLLSKENGLWTDFGGASRMGGPGCGGVPFIYTDAAYFRCWDYAVARSIKPDVAMACLTTPKPSATHGPGPQAQPNTSYAAGTARERWQATMVIARRR